MIFRDREEAGRLLAAKLAPYREAHPVVLALPRGGVQVAAEVARALGAPLDVLVVRKLGAPGSPEYALGAIAEGGAVWLSPAALDEEGVSDDDVARIAGREAAEVARRVRAYRGARPLPDVEGRTVIVVDDGVATGATAHAAARALRDRGAQRVVLATPVIAAPSGRALRGEFDEVVAVDEPGAMFAIGSCYDRFPQVPDEEVVAHLRRARKALAEPEGDDWWNGEWIEPAAPAGGAREVETEEVLLPCGPMLDAAGLEGDLSLPAGARALVAFVHGSGSTRRSPRNQQVARVLQDARLGTLLFDLLTPSEAAADARTGAYRFDVERLTGRVVAIVRALGAHPRVAALPLALFGASTGAAAALGAAAVLPDRVSAVVSRGGRPDLVPSWRLESVRAPVLLVVGGWDEEVLELNRAAAAHLARAELHVVPGAGHLFAEPGALDAVARIAARWLVRQLACADRPQPRP